MVDRPPAERKGRRTVLLLVVDEAQVRARRLWMELQQPLEEELVDARIRLAPLGSGDGGHLLKKLLIMAQF